MIYNMLKNYDEKSSHQKNYIEMAVLLFQRLAARGWDTTLLQHIFNDDNAKVETKYPFKSQERKLNPDDGRN